MLNVNLETGWTLACTFDHAELSWFTPSRDVTCIAYVCVGVLIIPGWRVLKHDKMNLDVVHNPNGSYDFYNIGQVQIRNNPHRSPFFISRSVWNQIGFNRKYPPRETPKNLHENDEFALFLQNCNSSVKRSIHHDQLKHPK